MKNIYIARISDNNSDAIHVTFNVKQALKAAEQFKSHLTSKERTTHVITVETYIINAIDNDNALDVYNTLIENDNFPYDPIECIEL